MFDDPISSIQIIMSQHNCPQMFRGYRQDTYMSVKLIKTFKIDDPYNTYTSRMSF